MEFKKGDRVRFKPYADLEDFLGTYVCTHDEFPTQPPELHTECVWVNADEDIASWARHGPKHECYLLHASMITLEDLDTITRRTRQILNKRRKIYTNEV